MKVTFRGLTTKQLYTFFEPSLAPTTVAEVLVTINGEPCVLCGDDGSIQRGVRGPTPPGAAQNYGPGVQNTVYDTYGSPSVWEQH